MNSPTDPAREAAIQAYNYYCGLGRQMQATGSAKMLFQQKAYPWEGNNADK